MVAVSFSSYADDDVCGDEEGEGEECPELSLLGNIILYWVRLRLVLNTYTLAEEERGSLSTWSRDLVVGVCALPGAEERCTRTYFLYQFCALIEYPWDVHTCTRECQRYLLCNLILMLNMIPSLRLAV